MKAFQCDRCHEFRTDEPTKIWFNALTQAEVYGQAIAGHTINLGTMREFCQKCHENIRLFAETSL